MINEVEIDCACDKLKTGQRAYTPKYLDALRIKNKFDHNHRDHQYRAYIAPNITPQGYEIMTEMFGPSVLADGKVCVMRHSVIKKDTNGNDYRAHGPIVCTGTINECEEFATDDDYVWRISRNQQFGGYYYRKSDRSILFVKEHNDGSDN